MRLNYSGLSPGQFALFQANCRRSLQSKKGQQALRELESALLALPEKRLIKDALTDEHGGVCAAHIGNTVSAGDEFPMLITRIWGSTPESAVNGQIMLDCDGCGQCDRNASALRAALAPFEERPLGGGV